MTVIAELAVNAVVRTEGAIKGAKKFRDEVGGMASFAARAGTALVALGATGAAAATELVRSQGSLADATDRTSQKLNISVEELSRFRYAAKMTADMADGAVDAALERMSTNIGMAAHGMGKARKAFDELRISAKYLSGLDTAAKVNLVADALDRVKSSADRTRLAEKIFGTGDFSLVVKGGRRGLAELGDESDRVGATLDTLANQKLADADNAFDRMDKSIDGAKHALGGVFAPAVAEAADFLTTFITSFERAPAAISMADRVLAQHNETLKANANARQHVLDLQKQAETKAGKAEFKRITEIGKREYEELQNDIKALKNQVTSARRGNDTFGMSELDQARYDRQNNMVDRGLNDQLIEELEVRQELERVRQREIDAKERDQQLDERAQGIIEQNITPLERLKKELADIAELQAAGKLNPEQAGRAIEAAQKGFKGGMESAAPVSHGPLGAIRFGSAESYRAIRESQHGERDKLSEKQLKELQEGNKLTKDMLDEIKALKAFNVAAWN